MHKATPVDDTAPHVSSCLVPAPPHLVYDAFVEPEALIQWLPPRGARGTIAVFEAWPGGRFDMTLSFADAQGKTSQGTDVVHSRFVELSRPHRIVFAVSFASPDPSFSGEMTMTWNFQTDPQGTRVTVVAQDVPSGIRRADHELGMRSTLENLKAYVMARA